MKRRETEVYILCFTEKWEFLCLRKTWRHVHVMCIICCCIVWKRITISGFILSPQSSPVSWCPVPGVWWPRRLLGLATDWGLVRTVSLTQAVPGSVHWPGLTASDWLRLITWPQHWPLIGPPLSGSVHCAASERDWLSCPEPELPGIRGQAAPAGLSRCQQRPGWAKLQLWRRTQDCVNIKLINNNCAVLYTC